jgi:hypothetical protein
LVTTEIGRWLWTTTPAQRSLFVKGKVELSEHALSLANSLNFLLQRIQGRLLPDNWAKPGEDAVGITGPKTAIEIPGSGQIRIPDALTDTTLTEVKNVRLVELLAATAGLHHV